VKPQTVTIPNQWARARIGRQPRARLLSEVTLTTEQEYVRSRMGITKDAIRRRAQGHIAKGDPSHSHMYNTGRS